MLQLKQVPPANAPAVMQSSQVLLPPLAPLNLAIQEVNPTVSRLTWNYPDGNQQRKLTAIEWSLCVGPGDNCPFKTMGNPPQININDKSLGTFLGFPFDKVKNGSSVVGVKMCYINVLGSGCARIDVLKPSPTASMHGVLPALKNPTPNAGMVKKGIKPASSVTGVAALNSGAINTAVAATPMAVNFGGVFSGDSQRATVRLVSPRDGKVMVALAPNSPFSITAVKVFGMAETKLSGQALTLAPKDAPALQSKAAAGKNAAPSVASSFSHKLLATASNAPFSVPVHDGNEIIVSLVFAPKFDLVNGPPVGDHNATLAINGGLWNATIPVSGRFEGLKIGIVAVMSNPDVAVFTDKTGAITEAELVLTNTEKQPVTVDVNSKRLPPGFSQTQLKRLCHQIVLVL